MKVVEKKGMCWALVAMLMLLLGLMPRTSAIIQPEKANSVLFVTQDHLSQSLDAIETIQSIETLSDKTGAGIKGVVIDSGLLSELSDKNREILRSIVDRGIPVLYIGKDVVPDYVATHLDISSAGGGYKSGEHSRLVAEGLFRRSDGLYHTITIAVPVSYEITTAPLLASAQHVIFATPDNSLQLPDAIQASASWIIKGSTSHLFEAGNSGRYYTSVACYILDPALDGDNTKDYWQVRAQHTTTANQGGFKRVYSIIDPSSDMDQAIVEYGPPGDYTGGTTASFSLSLMPPSVSFSFNVGSSATQLVNQSDPAYPRIRHYVDYGSGSPEASGSLAWPQAFTLSVPEGTDSCLCFFMDTLNFALGGTYGDDWYYWVAR